MDKAEQAYEAAKAEIARVKAAGGDQLDLSGDNYRALTSLPPEIAELTGLQTLRLNNTQITELAPLAGLTGLQRLTLDNTRITEFAPLAGLTGLQFLTLDTTRITELAPLAGLTGLQFLYLNNTRITELAPLAGLTGLQTLFLSNTQITELAPLAGLTGLRDFTLRATKVADLRPIAALDKLGTGLIHGLTFRNTPATARDAKLAELAEIKDYADRTRQTLAYLRSLPPWPEPYTPAATPDGAPPKPIGGVPEREKIKTAQTQIQHLIRNATVTRVTAQTFATQIEDALRDVPATHGNQLAEPLQTMQEFAEVLRGLAPETTPTDDPLQTAHLELRISQLEALVDRLTHQLADETKAREAAEALAKKERLISTHNKAFAAEAGKWNARLVYIGVPSAAFYFLGAENPLAILLSKVMAGAIK